MTYIDRAIKDVWKKEIRDDNNQGYLLQEDTLKNALYYHLRNRLSRLLRNDNIRIFTELCSGPLASLGIRADMAIVKIDDNSEQDLKDRITEIYALIELKFKSSRGSNVLFLHDVHKVLKLFKKKGLRDCQFYLGFIHEYGYEPDEDSWLSARQQHRASGRLTELSACHYTGQKGLRFTVVSHNGMNDELNDNFPLY